MGHRNGHQGRMVWCFLLSVAAACLASGSAFAASALFSAVGQITVQPTTVCAQNCTACSPVNDKGQTTAPDYIGFIDPATGANVTEEILSSELGLRVTWLPVVKYCSPINTFSNPSYNTTFQTLHVAQQADGSLSSADFMTLAQQPFGPASGPPYTVPNPTTPPGGTTPCAIDSTTGTLLPPCVPVSISPTTMNMFFVNDFALISPLKGKVYGYGMVTGNGIAINAGGLDPTGKPLGGIFKPPAPTPPQIDVPAHEIVHNLGLPHITTPKSDLETPGGTRTVPALSTFFQGLTAGTVDQLNTMQFQQVNDPSSYIRPFEHVIASVKASDPSLFPPGSFDYTINAPDTNDVGAPLTRLIFVFESPKGFQPSSFFVTNNGGLTVTGSQFNGNVGSGQQNSIFCGAGSIKCWEVDISPGLPPSDTVAFRLRLSSSIKGAQLSDLANSLFIFFFNNFATTSDLNSNPSQSPLTWDSSQAELTTGAFVVDPTALPTSGTPCTLSPPTVTKCTFKPIDDGDIQKK